MKFEHKSSIGLQLMPWLIFCPPFNTNKTWCAAVHALMGGFFLKKNMIFVLDLTGYLKSLANRLNKFAVPESECRALENNFRITFLGYGWFYILQVIVLQMKDTNP